MKTKITSFLLLLCINTIAQSSQKRDWVDTRSVYSDSLGNVVVHNSLPKGGGGYLDFNNQKYSYVIFWTQLTNESNKSLDVTIKFPANPFPIFQSQNSYLRIFAPPDTMTIDKIQLGDYGLTNLQSLLNAGFNKPSVIQKTIGSFENYLFYVMVILHEARGSARSSLIIKGQDLFYKVRIGNDSTVISCGKIAYKN